MDILSPEMEALKGRLKTAWNSGDYGHFAKYLEPGALEFLGRIPIQPGKDVLDVACGAGQISIPAARAGAHVVGIDIASNWITQANERARSENLDACFEEGDAEMLPYEAASFDFVVSLIGAMFAPRPERVAAELLRVCRAEGQIVMGNWTPTGLIGRLFKIIGQHVPPSALMPAPVLWGDEATVRQRLGDGAKELVLTKRMYPFYFPFPPAELVEFFRTFYGPVYRAFAALDESGQAALRRDLEIFWTDINRSTDGCTSYEAEYLEVVAIRQ